MGRKIGALLNGDLTDPLSLNVMIYICTYLMSILSSFFPYLAIFGSEEFNVNDFAKTLTDCIVPTTATLVAGNAIQNMAIVGRKRLPILH